MFKKKLLSSDELDEIDSKHNISRINADLGWISNDFNTLISIYWFDNELKNICFPWILKIERELKSKYIWMYKKHFNSNLTEFLLDKKMYMPKKSNTHKIGKLIDKIKEQNMNTIDELIFSLTFGEFVNIIICFCESLINKYSNHIGLPIDVFVNIIKYLNIVRNVIAHNKSMIKINDKKNDKKFSLKLDFFKFEITKEDADIISINFSGVIYAIYIMIQEKTFTKQDKFLKDVKSSLKNLKRNIDKNSFANFMNTIFLKYEKCILKATI